MQQGVTTATTPRLVVGDFNGDDKADLLQQNVGGELFYWFSSGQWGESKVLLPGTQRVGSGWGNKRILTGDFNADGRTDIVAVSPEGGATVWESRGGTGMLFVGSGSVHEGLNLTVSKFPRLFTMDIDGDRDSDLLAQQSDGSVWLWRSSGNVSGPDAVWNTAPLVVVTGGWTASAVPHILVGDFDGDGRSDLSAVYADGRVTTSITSGDPAKPLQGVSRTFDPGFKADAYLRFMIGDADGDGRDDIFAIATDGKIWLWLSTGDTSGQDTLLTKLSRHVAGTFTPKVWPRLF